MCIYVYTYAYKYMCVLQCFKLFIEKNTMFLFYISFPHPTFCLLISIDVCVYNC